MNVYAFVLKLVAAFLEYIYAYLDLMLNNYPVCKRGLQCLLRISRRVIAFLLCCIQVKTMEFSRDRNSYLVGGTLALFVMRRWI